MVKTQSSGPFLCRWQSVSGFFFIRLHLLLDFILEKLMFKEDIANVHVKMHFKDTFVEYE